MPSVDQLADMTEFEFAFLSRAGWSRVGRDIIAPDQFKGGFVLRYAKPGRALELRYLDIEFEAQVDGAEIYGPTVHPGFSGNQFSREHLREYLPRLARAIESHAQL